MRYTPQLLVSIVFVLSINFLFVRCGDQHEQTLDKTPAKTIAATEDTSLINQGKLLFVNNCGVCHKILATDNHLAGVVQRVGEDYLKLYVTKQDSLIKAKNKYALELKKVFGNLANAHNFKFSNQQMNAIIAYLKKYSS
jgi:mono/diheme cytochrome c family protein